MEGNLGNEVGLVVLDTIELFCGHFKVSADQCLVNSPCIQQSAVCQTKVQFQNRVICIELADVSF